MNNEYRRRDDGTIEIMLAKGKIALIDVGDLDVVATYDHWDTNRAVMIFATQGHRDIASNRVFTCIGSCSA